MITPRKIMPTNGERAAATVEWGRLIEAVATRRDRAAFVALFEHFAPRVKTFALRSGASAATAEELAQETMLTVWRRAELVRSRQCRRGRLDIHHCTQSADRRTAARTARG